MKRLQVYEGDGVLVSFDPNVCIHSAICLRALPAVFDVSEKRWIRPEAASADEVTAVVAKCPQARSRRFGPVRLGLRRRPRRSRSPKSPPGQTGPCWFGVPSG